MKAVLHLLNAMSCLLFIVPVTSLPAAEDNGMPTFDIPRVDGIAIDGKTDDWGDRGFRLDFLGNAEGQVRPPAEFDAKARLAWDARGLLVLVTVTDPTPIEDSRLEYLYSKDSVEIFVAAGLGSPDSIQVMISPGIDPKFSEPRHVLQDRRSTPELKATPPAAEFARTRTASGYILEARVPWSNFGIQPAVGREVAFQINVNDAFAPGMRYQVMWYPFPGAYGDSRAMQKLRLAEKPGLPVFAAVAGGYDQARSAWIKVTAPAEHVGAAVEIRETDRVLASGNLAAETNRAAVRFALPVPAIDKTFSPVTAFIDGRPVASVVLPDAVAARRQVFENARPAFRSYCFSGATFPACDLADADAVREVVGGYTMTNTFYDRDRKPVSSAEKPGRYAAVVDVTSGAGWRTKRYSTLFRLPDGLAPQSPDELLKAFGSSLDALKEQDADLAGKLPGSAAAFVLDPLSAQLLAALSEHALPACKGQLRWSLHFIDRTWWFPLKCAMGDAPSDYLLTLPPGYDAARKEPWPLIVFLHGSGGGEGVLAGFVKDRKDFPFIILAPKSPRESWLPVAVKADLDDVLAKYPVDRDRIYLTGLSMGGVGTWSVAFEYPDLFAAIAPVCGLGDTQQVTKVKHVPAWIFHGAWDASVPFASGQAMADAMTKAGGKGKFTAYLELGHDSWTPTYSGTELFDWFLQQRRGK